MLRGLGGPTSPFRTQSVALPAAFAFFHLAFAIAESLALPAALIFFLGFLTALVAVELFSLAHRARAAAAIAARPAALIFRFLGAGAASVGAGAPSSRFSSCCSFNILSWILAAFLRAFGVRPFIGFIKAQSAWSKNEVKPCPVPSARLHPLFCGWSRCGKSRSLAIHRQGDTLRLDVV